MAFGPLVSLLAACSRYTVVLDFDTENDPRFAREWSLPLPRIVTHTQVTLEGEVPKDGARLNYPAIQLPAIPRLLDVDLEGVLDRSTHCLKAIEGRVTVQLYLGSAENLWQHALGDPLDFDLTRARLNLHLSGTFDEAQKEALIGGNLCLGAYLRGEVALTPDTGDACALPDNPDSTDVRLGMRLRLDRMTLRAEVY